jgi:AAA+ ATPase superfamily predicted ATPase
LFRILYQLAGNQKTLVVVDEFPYLLGSTKSQASRTLSSIQAIMEQHRDDSKLKLILCGSAVAQMEDLQAERNPLHGRLQAFALRPLPFAEARTFMPALAPIEQFTRFSIAGGMPRYLSALATGDLAKTLAAEVVDRFSPLFNEPLSVLQAEVREPTIYLAILEQLAGNPRDIGAISSRTGTTTSALSPYLENLQTLGLVRKRDPIGAAAHARAGQWLCDDGFIRFWFRFVHPYQADLEAGADPLAHVRNHVVPYLPEHTSLPFEDVFRRSIRQDYPQAPNVGAWWGPALNAHRQAKTRFTEEIDAVGVKGNNVLVVGEAKWTNRDLPRDVLTELQEFKIPALMQAGWNISKELHIVLSSKNGFTKGVVAAATADERIHLVHAKDLLSRER